MIIVLKLVLIFVHIIPILSWYNTRTHPLDIRIQGESQLSREHNPEVSAIYLLNIEGKF